MHQAFDILGKLETYKTTTLQIRESQEGRQK